MNRRNTNNLILQNRASLIQRRQSIIGVNRVSNSGINKLEFFLSFRKKLSKSRRNKYKGIDPEKIQIEKINQIIFNKKTHMRSIYIDTIISCEQSEFLSKLYPSKKGHGNLLILTEFYENNTKFSPAYFKLNINIQQILYKNLKEKQKLIDKNENNNTKNSKLLSENSYSKNENREKHSISQETFLNSEFLRDIETERISNKLIPIQKNKILETKKPDEELNSKIISLSRNQNKIKLNQSITSVENLVNRIENIENRNYLKLFTKNVPEVKPSLILQGFLQGKNIENFNTVLITTLTNESLTKNEISYPYPSPKINKFKQKFYEKTHKFTDAQNFLDRLNEAKVLKKKEQEIIFKMHRDIRLLRTYELDIKTKDPIVTKIQPALFLPPLDVNMSEIKSACDMNERKIKTIEARNKNNSVSKIMKINDIFKSADLYDKNNQISLSGIGSFNQSHPITSINTATSLNEIQDSEIKRIYKYKNKMKQRKIESYSNKKNMHDSFKNSIGLDKDLKTSPLKNSSIVSSSFRHKSIKINNKNFINRANI